MSKKALIQNLKEKKKKEEENYWERRTVYQEIGQMPRHIQI